MEERWGGKQREVMQGPAVPSCLTCSSLWWGTLTAPSVCLYRFPRVQNEPKSHTQHFQLEHCLLQEAFLEPSVCSEQAPLTFLVRAVSGEL